MGTFSSIQTRVQTRVIDLPAAVLAEVPALVNLALTKLQEKHNFKVMEAEFSAVTNRLASDSGRFLVALPPTFKEFRDKPFWIKADGTVKKLETAQKRGDVWGPDYMDNADIGYPLVLVQEVGMANAQSLTPQINLDVYPLPDGNSDYSDGEYRIFIPYWNYLPPLVAAGDANWFTVYAEEWLVAFAAAEAFAIDWDEERMAVWTQRANKYFADVVLQDKRARLAGVDTLVPHRLGSRQSHLRI